LAQAFTKGITKNTDGSRMVDVSFGLVKRYARHAAEDKVAAEDWKKHTAAKEAAKRESENVGKSTKAKAGESSKPRAGEASKEKATGKGAKEAKNAEVVVKLKAAATSTEKGKATARSTSTDKGKIAVASTDNGKAVATSTKAMPRGARSRMAVEAAVPVGKMGEGEKGEVKKVEVEKKKQPVVGVKRAREEEEQAEGGSEVEVVERSIKGKSKAKDAGKKKPRREEESAGSGSEEEKEKVLPKPKRHADGGYMSVPRKNRKVVISPSVVMSEADEEEAQPDPKAKPKPKPKPKPKAKPQTKQKAQAAGQSPSKVRGKPKSEPVEEGRATRRKARREAESDAEEEQDEDQGEQSENDDEEGQEGKRAPLEIAQARAGAKKKALPKGDSKDLPQFIELEDKCALCAKYHEKCIWTLEAIKKSGAKACTRCNAKKTGCVSGFKSSGPVVLDMRTALGDLVDSIAPIPSSSRGLPRAGVVGDSTEHPTSIGELLVEVLNTARAVREENLELRAEVDNVSRTVSQMIVNYDSEAHREMIKEFITTLIQGISPAPPPPHVDMSSRMSTRASLEIPSPPRVSVSPSVTFSALDRTSPLPIPEVTPPPDTSAVPDLDASPALASLPLLDFLELDLTNLPPIPLGENDIERIALPPPPTPPAALERNDPNAPSSASRAGVADRDAAGVETDAEEVDEDAEGEEDKEAHVPSAVAQRTRLRTKPATKPVGVDEEEDEMSDGESDGEVPKGRPSKKRKGPVDAEDEDGGDDAATKKKAKIMPKKPAKGKAAGKKAT
jgi:hypothetical protein